MALLKCPRCDGEGIVPSPTTILGVTCPVCRGRTFLVEAEVSGELKELKATVASLTEQVKRLTALVKNGASTCDMCTDDLHFRCLRRGKDGRCCDGADTRI